MKDQGPEVFRFPAFEVGEQLCFLARPVRNLDLNVANPGDNSNGIVGEELQLRRSGRIARWKCMGSARDFWLCQVDFAPV